MRYTNTAGLIEMSTAVFLPCREPGLSTPGLFLPCTQKTRIFDKEHVRSEWSSFNMRMHFWKLPNHVSFPFWKRLQHICTSRGVPNKTGSAQWAFFGYFCNNCYFTLWYCSFLLCHLFKKEGKNTFILYELICSFFQHVKTHFRSDFVKEFTVGAARWCGG